tara:strand:- start:7657 stop:8118 length:462 start_codon:yes stop_codon:yes gene_type:complete
MINNANSFQANSGGWTLDKPSQWIRIQWLLLAVGVTYFSPEIGIIPLAIWLYHVIDLYFWSWTYTSDSIIERRGILNVNTEEIQYFRIKDVQLYEPFLYRLVGLSKIILITSDETKPIIVLDGIADGEGKREMFKTFALQSRRSEGIREFDIR